jgi:hypothetical protein
LPQYLPQLKARLGTNVNEQVWTKCGASPLIAY